MIGASAAGNESSIGKDEDSFNGAQVASSSSQLLNNSGKDFQEEAEAKEEFIAPIELLPSRHSPKKTDLPLEQRTSEKEDSVEEVFTSQMDKTPLNSEGKVSDHQEVQQQNLAAIDVPLTFKELTPKELEGSSDKNIKDSSDISNEDTPAASGSNSNNKFTNEVKENSYP